MKSITQLFSINLETKRQEQNGVGYRYKGFHIGENIMIKATLIPCEVYQKHEDYFLEQIIKLSDLNKYSNPHFFKFYGHEVNKEGLYIFYEYCSGKTLKCMIQDGISEQKVASIFVQIIEALQFMIEKNFSYQGITPDNIYIDENDMVKIGDLNFVRPLFQMENGINICPPLYAAPEAFAKTQGHLQEEKFHIWNIGLILFEMLTRNHLYCYQVGATEKTFTKSDLKLSLQSIKKKGIIYPSNMSKCWQRLINFMMVFDYKKRPNFAASREQLYKQTSEICKEDLSSSSLSFLLKSQLILVGLNPYSEADSENKDCLLVSTYQIEEKKQFSYKLLTILRKHISFLLKKSQLFHGLIQRFKIPYNYIHNVHKYMLMFLAVSISKLENENFLKCLKERVICVDGEYISSERLIPDHQIAFQQIMVEAISKVENIQDKEKKYFKRIFENIVKYQNREKERKLLEQDSELYDLIQIGMKDAFGALEVYEDKYHQFVSQRCIINPNCHKELDWEEAKTYAYIRLIEKIDQELPPCSTEDSIQLKVEMIEKKDIHTTIGFILRMVQNQ